MEPRSAMEYRGTLHRISLPGLWIPGNGPSGLLAIVRTPPLVAVVGNRVLPVEDGRVLPVTRRETSVTLGGLVIINATRRSEPVRVIGHPDLASGTSVQHSDTLYVSVAEAIYRQRQGEEVEIHLSPSPEDEEALSGFRTRARRRWEGDRLPDGWTRPLRPYPEKTEESFDDGVPEELRPLADRIRAKGSAHGSGLPH